jgi:hypothetical protein
MTYTRVKAATDITYTAEVAGSSTGSWSSAVADVDQTWQVVDRGDTESVTAGDKTAMTNAVKRFLRLKVSQP